MKMVVVVFVKLVELGSVGVWFDRIILYSLDVILLNYVLILFGFISLMSVMVVIFVLMY